MTEDEARQLIGIYERNTLELFTLVNGFSNMAMHKTASELLDWKRQEYKESIVLLEKHLRELDWRAGEKIEPQVHFAEAVLVGKAGMDG